MKMSEFHKLKDGTTLVYFVTDTTFKVREVRRIIKKMKQKGEDYKSLIKDMVTLKQTTRWDKDNGIYEECKRCGKNSTYCGCKGKFDSESKNCSSCEKPLSEFDSTPDFGETWEKGLMCTNKTCKLLHKRQKIEVVQ